MHLKTFLEPPNDALAVLKQISLAGENGSYVSCFIVALGRMWTQLCSCAAANFDDNMHC